MSRYFNLREAVYFVRGRARSVLYASLSGQIYWLSRDATALIHQFVEERSPLLDLPVEAAGFLDGLVARGLGTYAATSGGLPNTPARPPSSIDLIWYEVTRRCNLSCVHCYRRSSQTVRQSHVLSLRREQHLLAEIASMASGRIQFIGGEPLLEWDRVRELIRAAHRHFSRVELFTNGTILAHRPDLVGFLRDHGVHVLMSFYSVDWRIHDCITRTQSSCDRMLKALEMLTTHSVSVGVSIIGMRLNAATVEETARYLRKRFDVDVHCGCLRLVGRADAGLLDGMPTTERRITVESFRTPFAYTKFAWNQHYHNCFGRTIAIGSDGLVHPCIMSGDTVVGNLREQRWPEIVAGEPLDRWRRLTKDAIEGCCQCEFRYFCHDCRPDAVYRDRGVLAKPWNCQYSPEHGEWRNAQEPEYET